MNNSQVDVPRYVLNLDHAPMRPVLGQRSPGETVTVIFGFSAKPKYDSFLLACVNKALLTPYPLVKGYMQQLLKAESSQLHLMAVDAASPEQVVLDAVTMQSIVWALENHAPHIAISHALVRDVGNQVYWIEEKFNEPTLESSKS